MLKAYILCFCSNTKISKKAKNLSKKKIQKKKYVKTKTFKN